jgi:hypothetical protein
MAALIQCNFRAALFRSIKWLTKKQAAAPRTVATVMLNAAVSNDMAVSG